MNIDGKYTYSCLACKHTQMKKNVMCVYYFLFHPIQTRLYTLQICLGGAVDSVMGCHACDWGWNTGQGKSHTLCSE